MALVEGTWSVRGYELDADGLVPPHVWLRYMENLRWLLATRGPAELIERFRAGDTFMVVAQALRVLRDVGLDSSITGRMWVGRVGRTSIDFWHSCSTGGRLAAAGQVTAVYVVRDKPAPLPDTLRKVEFEPGMSDVSFPEPMRDRAPEGAFHHRLQVRPADLDILRHVNHSNYAVFIDAARHAGARLGALAHEWARRRIRGMRIDYAEQARLGQELSVATWVVDDDPSLGFEVTCNRTVLSRARVTID